MSSPLTIGENGTWLNPKLVPAISTEERPALEAKAQAWHNIDWPNKDALNVALSALDGLPAEVQRNIALAMSILQHRMWIIFEREASRRDREYARLFVATLEKLLEPNHPLIGMWKLNADAKYETQTLGKVEAILRERIKKDLESATDFLKKVDYLSEQENSEFSES